MKFICEINLTKEDRWKLYTFIGDVADAVEELGDTPRQSPAGGRVITDENGEPIGTWRVIE